MGRGSEQRARAAKLERKREMVGLAPVRRAPKQGRARMKEIEEGAQTETLRTRAAQMGKKPTADNLREVKAAWFTDEAGRALYIAVPNEVADLWKVVEDWRKCENRFLHHVIGKRMYPGNDSIPHMPTPMETRDDVDYDLRTEEEKADAAKQAFWAFCAHTDVLTEAQRRICMRGIWDSNPVFTQRDWSPNEDKEDIPGKPRLTFEGAAFVAAIKRLAVELTKG